MANIKDILANMKPEELNAKENFKKLFEQHVSVTEDEEETTEIEDTDGEEEMSSDLEISDIDSDEGEQDTETLEIDDEPEEEGEVEMDMDNDMEEPEFGEDDEVELDYSDMPVDEVLDFLSKIEDGQTVQFTKKSSFDVDVDGGNEEIELGEGEMEETMEENTEMEESMEESKNLDEGEMEECSEEKTEMEEGAYDKLQENYKKIRNAAMRVINENKQLKAKLKETKGLKETISEKNEVIKKLRGIVSESTLANRNLMNANRLMLNHSLSTSDCAVVFEKFTKEAKTLSESDLMYSLLNEQFSSRKDTANEVSHIEKQINEWKTTKNKKQITESKTAKVTTKETKVGDSQLNESFIKMVGLVGVKPKVKK